MTGLIARRLDRRDLQERVAWFNTPSVYSQMTVSVPFSLDETEAWFRRVVTDHQRHDFSFDLMEQGESVTLAAMGGLVDVDPLHRHAELYIIVNPSMTGRGIGSEAIRWLCTYGFVTLDLYRIFLFTLANNERARRLYERLGFGNEGILRKHLFHRGDFVDRHVQGLLKPDWEKQPWRFTGLLV